MSDDRDESLLDFKRRAAAADIHDVAERRLGVRLEREGEHEWSGRCPRCGGGLSINAEASPTPQQLVVSSLPPGDLDLSTQLANGSGFGIE